jgi:hypothetical protein
MTGGVKYVITKFPFEGHVWFFNDAGRVVKYQHVTETVLHQRAANGE